jgi:hypothetical protein
VKPRVSSEKGFPVSGVSKTKILAASGRAYMKLHEIRYHLHQVSYLIKLTATAARSWAET